MKKIIVSFFAVLIFSVPFVTHANFFAELWDTYVFTLAGIGQTAAAIDAFPRDKYIDVKVNGSDGPAAVSNSKASIVRWVSRSVLLKNVLKECRITYPTASGTVSKSVAVTGTESVVLNPAVNGSSYVELYCKKGSREFRDTVQIVVSDGTQSAVGSQRSQSAPQRSGGSVSPGGVNLPYGVVPNVPSVRTYNNVEIPGIGNTVIPSPFPTGPSPEEQQIQEQVRLQAQ